MKNTKNDDIIIQDVPIDKVFENDIQMQNEAVKELFYEAKVKARTDLSSSQISKVTRIYYLANLLDMPELKVLMDEFITLRISKDRKSRSEFVEGLKSKIDNNVLTGQMPMRQQFQR